MPTIQRLQPHIREKLSRDRFVSFGNVPCFSPLDEESRTVPCRFSWGVREVADSGDRLGQDGKRDSELECLGLLVDQAVCEEELSD